MTLRHMLGALTAASAISMASFAAAHHGWNWAQDEQSEMTGIIESISFAPPHPSLVVAIDGENWDVELGNPNQTQRAGFVEGEAGIGDEITILGHRSLDETERVVKAVRITIDGRNYDLYPDRIQDE